MEFLDPAVNLGSHLLTFLPKRNGSAFDSRSKGYLFKSGVAHILRLFFWVLFFFPFGLCISTLCELGVVGNGRSNGIIGDDGVLIEILRT